MFAIRNILTISKREITRFRTRFTGRSRFVLIAIILLCLLISYIMYHQSFVLSKGLYTVGVSPDGPVITDSRFRVLTLDLETACVMLHNNTIDIYICGNEAMYTSDQRSLYAAGALKQYLENREIIRIANEYEINQAFPLRIEINHLESPANNLDAEIEVSLSDILGLTETPAAPSTIPVPTEVPGQDVPTPSPQHTESSTDAAVRQQLSELGGSSSRLPKFKAEFASDKDIIIPSLMDPPVPLAQVIMAFFYVVPIFFVSVFFTSSFMEEKTNRKLVLLLSAPVTPFQIILGKMLPYIGYSIAVIIVVTLLLKGNMLLALAIFIPVMLFILSVYLMVALTYRTFRDQTFFSVLAVAAVTAYLVAPAMFAGVSDLSYISPLTLAVEMYRGESFGLTEYLLSTAPMYLVFLLALFVGKRIFNEEYLTGFRPLHAKLGEAIYLVMDRNRLYLSVFLLSLFLIPIVFMVQLSSIVFASNLPMPFALGAVLAMSVVAEELAKSAGIAILLQNNIVKSLKVILMLSFISALGFLIGEKLLLYLALSVISESMFTTAIFSTGLLIMPLIMHFVSTSMVCLMTARFGIKYYPVAVIAGAVIHTLYNLYILGGIL
jgi:ABC-type Na+ efflux pump permease subunit